MSAERVLVVGTTADYIDIIRRRFPGRALFLTEPKERRRPSPYGLPGPGEEVLFDLSDFRGAGDALARHLERRGIELSGIACFDCESLALAAELAGRYSLLFPSPEAVAASRNKFTSKKLWREAGIPCPRVQLVRNPEDAVGFLRKIRRPVVLKPLTGSGSEFVFLCREEKDCRRAFATMRQRLRDHPDRRMYGTCEAGGENVDSRRTFVAEEYLEGEEYSCDILLREDGLKLIRVAGKIFYPEEAFGTVLAYVLPSSLPAQIDPSRFRSQLLRASRALGLERSICMLDFIVNGGEVLFLELTPRPGGDCLPALERLSSGFDMLGFALDVADGRPLKIPAGKQWRRLVGLQILAECPGVIRKIDTGALRADPRVLGCSIEAGTGYRVLVPPENYDSRRLGHVIFRPEENREIGEQCRELAGMIRIEMEDSR